MATAKEEAKKLLNQLPDQATWDEVVYEVIVRREIELGLAESKAGYTTPAQDILKEFGISEE